MVVPAREKCLLEQQSLHKCCLLSREVFAFGRHADLAPLGRAGPMCKAGGKPALHSAGHAE